MENINQSFRKRLMMDAIETCASSSCLIKKHPNSDQLTDYQHAPISLFPTPYPFHIYKQVFNYQKPTGILVS